MVIDFHTHVFPPEVIARRAEYAERDAWFAELYSNPKAKMATVDDLLASMDADGVDVSVACAFGWRDQGLIEECDSYLLEAIKAHGSRIVGLAGAQPLAGARAIAEIERCAKGGNARRRRADAARAGVPPERCRPAYPADGGGAGAGTVRADALQRAGRASLQGQGRCRSRRSRRLRERLPERAHRRLALGRWLPVLRADAGGTGDGGECLVRLGGLALSLCATVFDVAARAAGARKLLWASDYPLISQRRMLEYARASGLSEADLALALGGNAAALLGLEE